MFKFKLNNNSIKNKKKNIDTDGKIQKILDGYVVATLPKYMKRATGQLIKNMVAMTKIGNGKITNTLKYSKKTYYDDRVRENITGYRGKLWFERWKQDNKSNALTLIQKGLKK